MTGDQINAKLERGLFGKYDIKEFKATPGFAGLNSPSDATFATGVADSVTQQAHRIDATWDATHKRLTLNTNAAGEGYWIPYLGNGAGALAGMAQTALRGLGAYTPAVAAGGGISWVVTGPFSGCHHASFTAGGNKVFAHVITPADGYTSDTVANQLTNIAAQVGAAVPGAGQTGQVVNGAGEGFVFWMRVAGSWYRRIVYAFGGTVNAVEAKVRI
jgi:hypothetical protein